MARAEGELASINSRPMHALNGYGVVKWPWRIPLILWWVKNIMLIKCGVLSLHHPSTLTATWSSNSAFLSLQMHTKWTGPWLIHQQNVIKTWTSSFSSMLEHSHRIATHIWNINHCSRTHGLHPVLINFPTCLVRAAEHTWIILISVMIIYT